MTHRRRLLPFLAAGPLAMMVMVPACNRPEISRSEPLNPPASSEDSIATAMLQNDDVDLALASTPDSGYFSETDNPYSSGPVYTGAETVGERLKRLDERMRLAPADSLGVLMEEYERLLDSAVDARLPQTASTPPVSAPTPSAVPSSPTSSEPIAALSPQSTPVTPSVDLAPSTSAPTVVSTPMPSKPNGNPRVLVQSDFSSDYITPDRTAPDPRTFEGARPSELTHYETTVATPTPSKPASGAKGSGKRTKGSSGKRSSAKPSSKGSDVSVAPNTTSSKGSPSSSSSSTDLDKSYTEGLAAYRAGDYADAIVNLRPVVSSKNRNRTTARYYYAASLEKNGDLSGALREYGSVKSGSGALADKAWLAYGRVLAALGKSDQAKQELLRFLKARSSSAQAANARALLQQI